MQLNGKASVFQTEDGVRFPHFAQIKKLVNNKVNNKVMRLFINIEIEQIIEEESERFHQGFVLSKLRT